MADSKEYFPSSLCNCSQKSAGHVHCPCSSCKGKAVNRRTQISHIRMQKEIENLSAFERDTSDVHQNRATAHVEMNFEAEKIHFPDESKLNLQSACDEMETTDEDGMEICIEDQDVSSLQTGEPVRCVASSYTEYPAEHVGCLNAAPPVSEESSEYEGLNHDEPTREQITKDAIVHAIFHALDCIDKMGGSLNSFADLLTMARVLYCKGAQLDPDDQDVLKEWPKGWSDAKKVLSDVGYTDAKEYFICLNDAHPCHWDILESSNAQCRHCGENGTIPYYFLGLETKVRLWISDWSMCKRMTAHWREKEHWFRRDEGWHTKKELWDGDRFCAISWFFDPESRWCLPVRCAVEGCNNIVSGETVESLPERPDGTKEVTCDECHHSFTFAPSYATGDPRNIALIGHWDGFQPFGSKSRSTGAIEVSIATMSKLDRSNAVETYTVGFVPSYVLPDKRPNSLDPFLQPLVEDLEKGFIEGINVDYMGMLESFPPGNITIRLLLLLWTGDHPAQCEVCKSKGAGGKKGCRRCKLIGKYLEAQKHYYYPGLREQFRFPPTKREIAEELPLMTEIEQEERTTVKDRMSKESGFLGVSLLHRLHNLYKFDIIKDLVFDVMHLVPLNLVKRRFEYLLSNSLLDPERLQVALEKVPWTQEYRASGLPLDIKDLKFWKAEEFQKLGFPASEFVLEGLLNPSDAEVWAPLPRIVESTFNCGLNGWTIEMIENFKRLCWKYCILVEEAYGESECVITLHSLTHVAEDIMRFGSPDNYWCFQYERAVGRYVKQTSNRKGVEKTFARKESQREFIKIWSERNKLNVQESNQRGKFDQEKMVASSVQAARKLVEKSEFTNGETRANNGVLIGKGHPHVIAREEGPNIETCLTLNNIDIRETPSMATIYNSALLPLHNLSCGGTVYKSGNEVTVLLQGDEEVIMKIIHFYLLYVEKQYISIVIGDRYKISNAANGDILRHPLSDGIIVQPFETNFCVLLKDITRKVMLYPYRPGGLFAVIDPGRTVIPLPCILVPVYPQIGDMVLVKGDDDELWRAHVRAVDHRSKSARGYFFVKHRNWNDNQQWVRESQARAMDTIQFKSIVGLVEGQWHGSYWKDS